MAIMVHKDSNAKNASSKFSHSQKKELLSVKGVGPLVIQRLEEIGIASFELLREYDSLEIVEKIANNIGSTCWKNSPQANRAIEAAISKADSYLLDQNQQNK